MIRDSRKVGVWFVVLLALSLLVPSAALRAEEGTAVASVATDVSATALRQRLAPLLAELGDSDFTVREGAQKRLDALGNENVGILRLAAAEETDPEVKARLTRRVARMEEQRALSLGRISLVAKDATLPQICAALREVGVPVREVAVEQIPEPRFTLDVKGELFAELLGELNKQHPLQGGSRDNDLHLSVKPRIQPMWWGANAVVMQNWITRSHSGDQLSLGLSVLIDPRVRIALCEVQLDHAEDERGNRLTVHDLAFRGPPGMLCMYAMVFDILPKSRQVAVAKGVIKATIAVRQETVEYDQPEKLVNKKVTLGKGASITITAYEGTADKVQVSAGWGPTEQQMAAALAQGTIKSRAEWRVTGQVIDAAGKSVVTIGPGEGSGIGGKNAAKLPLKMQLTVPTETAEILIPFEFRNIEAK